MEDRNFLLQAIHLAESSHEPVKCGSILVDENGNVIASSYNSQREDGLVASHAEMKSIAIANRILGRKLQGVTAYGNCEPCTMCLTALIFAGVSRIVFAKRLNEFVDDTKKINIDCFEFVKQFPKAPLLEHVSIDS